LKGTSPFKTLGCTCVMKPTFSQSGIDLLYFVFQYFNEQLFVVVYTNIL